MAAEWHKPSRRDGYQPGPLQCPVRQRGQLSVVRQQQRQYGIEPARPADRHQQQRAGILERARQARPIIKAARFRSASRFSATARCITSGSSRRRIGITPPSRARRATRWFWIRPWRSTRAITTSLSATRFPSSPIRRSSCACCSPNHGVIWPPTRRSM